MGIIDAGGGRWFEIHCVEIPILSCKCLQLCTLALDFGFGGCTRGFDIGIFCMLDLYQRVYWMIMTYLESAIPRPTATTSL
jgi:hypothetical protein